MLKCMDVADQALLASAVLLMRNLHVRCGFYISASSCMHALYTLVPRCILSCMALTYSADALACRHSFGSQRVAALSYALGNGTADPWVESLQDKTRLSAGHDFTVVRSVLGGQLGTVCI